MTALGGGPLEFGMSNDGVSLIGNTITVNAPASTTSPLSYFNAPGMFFVVKNQNNFASGEYKIEFLG